MGSLSVALGLIYAELLTGALPAFDTGSHQYAGVAARAGEILRLPPTTLPPSLVELVDQMLLADPGARPTIGEVHTALMGIRTTTATTTAVVTAPRPGRTPTTPSRLKGRGLRTATPPTPAPAAEPRLGRRLRGKLLERGKGPDTP